MDAMALLLAEKNCRDLVLAAAEAVDAQAYEAFAAMFTDDASLVRPGGQPLQGRAEILASYRSKSSERLTRHLVCNHRVVVDPSGLAESRCAVLLYVTDKHRTLTNQGRLADPTQKIGAIHDYLVLTADGWRICKRQAWFEMETAK